MVSLAERRRGAEHLQRMMDMSERRARCVPKLGPPSRGPPVIVVQNTTEPLPTLNRGIHPGAVDQLLDQLIVEPLVIAFNVIVLRVLLHGLAKVTLAQRDAQKTS